MSPLLWDLAHVANYEDLWLVRALGGEPTRDGLDDLYDAFQQPRGVREALPLLDLADARAYGDAVRARALDLLDAADLGPDSPEPLLRHGFVHRMVAQHEHQHAETLLAAIQLLPADEGHGLDAPAPPPRGVAPPAEVLVAGGPVPDGHRRSLGPRQRAARARGRRAGVLDRRRARHQRAVPALRR